MINGEVRYFPAEAFARRRHPTGTRGDGGGTGAIDDEEDDDEGASTRGRRLVVRTQPWHVKHRAWLYAGGVALLLVAAVKAGPHYGVLLLVVAGLLAVSRSTRARCSFTLLVVGPRR